MASIEFRPSRSNPIVGCSTVRFRFCGESKHLSFDSRYSRSYVEEISRVIELLANSIETGEQLDRKTSAWIDCVAPDVRFKLESVGLLRPLKRLTNQQLWNEYKRSQSVSGVKDSTIHTYDTVSKRFISFFGADSYPNDITKDDCIRWRSVLVNTYAEASVASSITRSKALFNWAIEREYVLSNPFNKVKRGSFVNENKRFFITSDMYRRMIDACPDQTWRTLLSLCRYGGLRNPSETLSLRWEHVDWDNNRITIVSPKTERYTGKDMRVIPLFPEIRSELEEQQRECDGSLYIINRWRDTAVNMRTALRRIIFRAGLDVWDDLFQNFRRSRDIELSSKFPAHVASAWMGHTTSVAMQHYLFPTDEDFIRAIHKD